MEQMHPTARPLEFVPQQWWEWAFSVYPPDRFAWEPRHYTAVVAASAATTGSADPIKIDDAFFCFGVRSKGFVTATGAAPTFRYRVRVQINDRPWFGTNGAESSTATGDSNGLVPVSRDWAIPRECYRSDALNVVVDNALNAATPITVDVTFFGYQVVARPPETIVRRG